MKRSNEAENWKFWVYNNNEWSSHNERSNEVPYNGDVENDEQEWKEPKLHSPKSEQE